MQSLHGQDQLTTYQSAWQHIQSMFQQFLVLGWTHSPNTNKTRMFLLCNGFKLLDYPKYTTS